MDIILRVVVTYAVIFVGLRVLGKRELSQLSAVELVTLMLVPEIVSQALAGQESMTLAFVGICTLFLLVYVTSLLSYLWEPAGKILDGTETVLKNENGLVLESLDKERISVDEIFSELRQAGFNDLSKIETIVLESDGKISLIPKIKEAKIDQQFGTDDNL
jgi:uncharacterized membrane protein YcaP (DUF421 family)